jgi:uncharacterized protein (DUF58 family)
VTQEVPWLDYGVRWRSGDPHPGRHAARHAGEGGVLRGYRPFWQMPDMRRIDVRRSLLEPMGELVVRQTHSRGTIGVILAADLSRSMRPGAGAGNFGMLATLVRALSRSAHRAGDAFGILGFDASVREDVSTPLTRARGPAFDIADRLSSLAPCGRSAAGMAQLASWLPERRCLVILASDFLVPLPLLQTALAALGRHDVAPVVLQDTTQNLPSHGLLRLRDAETGGRRLLLMRPRLRARILAAAHDHAAARDAVFLRHCRPAFHAAGALDLPALGQHLLQS